MTNHAKELLTTADLMELLGTSRSSIYRYSREGLLKPIRITSRRTLYKRSDVNELLDAAQGRGLL